MTIRTRVTAPAAAGAVLLGALLAASPAAAQTFTGPRVEATIGWDQMHFDLGNVGQAGRAKQSGLDFGGAVGYDQQVGTNLIAGVEASATGSDTGYTTGTAANGTALREKRDLSIAARLGTKVTPNTLLYGKVGYSNLQVGTTTTAAGTVTSQYNRDLDGVVLGAGLEVAISPKAYLKTEYDYSNYAAGVTKNDILTGIGLRF